MRILERKGRRLAVVAGSTKLGKNVLLDRAAAMSTKAASVRIMDARLVFGEDHVRSAFDKAARAIENSTNVSDSLATETMLYLSGCRQIQEAVELVGMKGDGHDVVCLVDQPEIPPEKVAQELEISRNDDAVSAAGKDAAAFGVGKAEMSTLPGERVTELVLERVASVDIKKK